MPYKSFYPRNIYMPDEEPQGTTVPPPPGQPMPGGPYYPPRTPRIPKVELPTPLPPSFPSTPGRIENRPYMGIPRPVTSAQSRIVPSAFIQDIYNQTSKMTGDDSDAYLAGIKESLQARMAKYTYRVARGRALTPAQQADFDAMRNSLNELLNYESNPQEVIQYMTNARVQANPALYSPGTQYSVY